MSERHVDEASGRGDRSGRHRVFFALSPDAAVGDAIAETVERLRDQWAPGGRRVGQHRFHMTLQFLGEFDEFPEALVQVALAAGSSIDTPAFSLTLDRAASFDHPSIVWWLGPETAPSALYALTGRLGDALQRQGLPPATQAFIPHLTIIRGARLALRDAVAVAPISWPVRAFALVHSRDDVHGYKVLREWTLTDPRNDL